MSDSSDYEFRNYRPGDEVAIVGLLTACLHEWRTKDLIDWRWEHAERPGFGSQDVVTVHHEGRMVGCFHGAVLSLRLEEGLEVPASFDGDFAILPDHRRRGLSTRAHDIFDQRLLEEGVALRGGFTSRELNERLYRRRYGYLFIPTDTLDFRKPLGPTAFRGKLEGLGDRLLHDPALRRRLERSPLTVEVWCDALPPFHLRLTGGSFRLAEGRAGRPDVTVRLPYRLLLAASRGPAALAGLAVADLLRGRVRAKGVLRRGAHLAALAAAFVRSRGVGEAGRRPRRDG